MFAAPETSASHLAQTLLRSLRKHIRVPRKDGFKLMLWTILTVLLVLWLLGLIGGIGGSLIHLLLVVALVVLVLQLITGRRAVV